MDAEWPTDREAIAFGRRIDAFVATLTPREQAFLTSVLRSIDTDTCDETAHRTPGAIVAAFHRARRSLEIGVNPQSIPMGQLPPLDVHTRFE